MSGQISMAVSYSRVGTIKRINQCFRVVEKQVLEKLPEMKC